MATGLIWASRAGFPRRSTQGLKRGSTVYGKDQPRFCDSPAILRYSLCKKYFHWYVRMLVPRHHPERLENTGGLARQAPAWPGSFAQAERPIDIADRTCFHSSAGVRRQFFDGP